MDPTSAVSKGGGSGANPLTAACACAPILAY